MIIDSTISDQISIELNVIFSSSLPSYICIGRMLLQYLGVLLLVAHSAARTYEGRNFQFTAISNKLDEFIGQLGKKYFVS